MEGGFAAYMSLKRSQAMCVFSFVVVSFSTIEVSIEAEITDRLLNAHKLSQSTLSHNPGVKIDCYLFFLMA